MDPRKDAPYEKYGEVDFDVPIGSAGDSYDRLWVLVQRMWESCKIIEQCMEKLPAGEFVAAEAPEAHQGPEGEIYVRTENPLGLMGYYVVGDERGAAVPAEDADRIVLERLRASPRSCPER